MFLSPMFAKRLLSNIMFFWTVDVNYDLTYMTAIINRDVPFTWLIFLSIDLIIIVCFN